MMGKPAIATAFGGLAAWLAIGLLLVSLSYFSLGHYDHNDHMYAVAPVLEGGLTPYRGFAFVQTPLSLLLYGVVRAIVGDQRLYTALRSLSLAMNLLVIVAGLDLCWRNSQRKALACLSFVGFYLAYRPDVIIGAEIGNYTLSLLLLAAALVLLDRGRGRGWTLAGVGVLAGLALSAKLSFIYAAAGFGLVALLWEGAPRRPLSRLAAYGAGLVVGIIPILVYLFADPDRFVFENVHFHYLSNLYRGISPLGGLKDLPLFSVGSGVLALLLLALVAGAVIGAARLMLRWRPDLRVLGLALTPTEKAIICLALAMIVGAVTPGVVFQQYLAAPAFLIILFAVLYLDRLWARGRLSERWRARGPLAMAMLAALLGAAQAAALTRETLIRQKDGVYGITAVAGMQAHLRAVIATIDQDHPHCHGDLVTAFGVPAIGAGARLSPIDSTGAFAMRLDDIFARRAPDFRWMSDPNLYLKPDSLILTGFYADTSYEPKSPFEATMIHYAAAHGFQAIPLGSYFYNSISLQVPPACQLQASPRG